MVTRVMRSELRLISSETATLAVYGEWILILKIVSHEVIEVPVSAKRCGRRGRSKTLH